LYGDGLGFGAAVADKKPPFSTQQPQVFEN